MALLTGACALPLAACGGSDSNGGGGSPGGATPVPIGDVPEKFASTFCSIVDSCFGVAYGLFSGGADCVTEIGREFTDGDFQNIKSGIDSETVIYHGELVQSCLDALLAEGCGALTSRMPAECRAAFEGTVAEGGSCTYNAECAGGNYCKIGASCPGTCAAPGGADTACESDDACQSGLLCDTAAKKCYAPAQEGATCGDQLPACTPGLVCAKADTAATGTCKTVDSYLSANEGEPCDPLAGGPLCKANLSCIVDSIDTSSGSPKIVWKCAAAVTSGSACHIGAPDPCPDGEYCDADLSTGQYQGTCKPLPADGQPCVNSAIGQQCAPYNICDASKTCQERQRLDGSCASSEECYSSNCSAGTCVPKSDCP